MVDQMLLRSREVWGRFVLYFSLAPSCAAVLEPDLEITGEEANVNTIIIGMKM